MVCRWVLLGVLFASVSGYGNSLEYHPVTPGKVWWIVAPDEKIPRFDPSGLVKYQGQWLVVSDRTAYNDIYKLTEVGRSKLQAETFLQLQLPASQSKGQPKHRQDFEGITYCHGRFYIVEEITNSLLTVELSGKTTVQPLDLVSIHKERSQAPATGTSRGGLEGVSCDAHKQQLYVANERQFRMIYVLKLGMAKPFDFFDVPAGWDSPRWEGRFDVFPDYTGLHFADGFLYALQRSDHQILKIDPKKKRLVAVLKYDLDERTIYRWKKPFGMAEGLYVDKEKIYLLLDNNGVGRRKKRRDISASLVELARPQGF